MTDRTRPMTDGTRPMSDSEWAELLEARGVTAGRARRPGRVRVWCARCAHRVWTRVRWWA